MNIKGGTIFRVRFFYEMYRLLVEEARIIRKSVTYVSVILLFILSLVVIISKHYIPDDPVIRIVFLSSTAAIFVLLICVNIFSICVNKVFISYLAKLEDSTNELFEQEMEKDTETKLLENLSKYRELTF